jgi:RNA polymerase sigma factor (sigma-70 family)
MNDFSDIDNAFIKNNEGIIGMAIGKYSWLPNYEDILQEARIWLLEAKIKYNPKNSKWSYFAKKYIIWKYQKYQRNTNTKTKSPEFSGYSVVCLDDISENELYDNSSNLLDEKMNASILYNSMLAIIPNERNRDIIAMVMLGYTQKEIGLKYGISKQRVHQIYKQELEFLKIKFNRRNYG